MTTRLRALALGLTMGSALAGSSAFAATIVEFDAPGAGTGSFQGTQVFGMSSKGDIVGNYISADGKQHGYIRLKDGSFVTFTPDAGTHAFGINQHRATTGAQDGGAVTHGFVGASDGTTTTFDVQGADDTEGEGINAKGDIAGAYIHEADSVFHAFLRSKNGHIKTFDAPDGGTQPNQGTFAEAINGHDVVVGYYVDGSNNRHGFVRDEKGHLDEFDAPGAVRTTPITVNNHATVGGSFRLASSGPSHGFLRDKDGAFTTFDVDNAGTGAGQGTFMRTVTKKGEVSGLMVDNGNVSHGYLRDKNGNITVFDAPDAGTAAFTGTTNTYLDDKGEAGGDYLDNANVYHGFFRAP
jgi:hypothetical protein